MAADSIKQNLVPNEPHLIDLLDLFKKDIMLNLNCHHLGTIESFDSTNQTAYVSINYKKTFFEFDAITNKYASKLVSYPVLAECPVIVLGGGTGALTFPIAAGDECLVLFNDRDLDNWFSGGSGSPNNTARLHSFADGIALVGIRSLANVLTGYDGTRAALRNGLGGTTLVGVGSTLIKIANNTTTLNTLLQTLITNIQTLVGNVSSLSTAAAAITVTGVTPGGSTSGPPANAPAFAAVTALLVTDIANLTATSAQISGLLE